MNKSSFFWPLMLGFFILSIFLHAQSYLSWDVNWGMELSSRLLHGGHYYTDFLEPNPPLFLYLYALPVGLHAMSGLSLSSSVLIFCYLLATGSLYLSHRILTLLMPHDLKGQHLILLGLCFSEILLPTFDLGQRENLMLMLIMPYVLLCTLYTHSTMPSCSLRIIIGAAAGLGFALKPHFLIPLLFIQGALLWKHKRIKLLLNPEAFCIATVMLLYLASIFILTPEYMTQVLPIVFYLYSYYESPPLWMLISDPLFLAILFSLLISFISLKQKNTPYPTLLLILLAAGLGFVVIYLLAGQLWNYHLLPALSIAVLLLLLNLRQLLKQVDQAHFDFLKHPGLCANFFISTLCVALIVAIVCGYTAADIERKNSSQSLANQLIHSVNLINQGPFMVFSTLMEPSTALLAHTHLRSSSRFASLWPIPGIAKLSQMPLNPEGKLKLKHIKEHIRALLITDLQNKPPYIILVDESPQKPHLDELDFNYINFMSEDARFRKIWKNYHYQTKVANYAIYSRTPSGS